MERETMSGEWGSATEDSGAQSPRTTSMSKLLASCADSWSYHHMVSANKNKDTCAKLTVVNTE